MYVKLFGYFKHCARIKACQTLCGAVVAVDCVKGFAFQLTFLLKRSPWQLAEAEYR